MCLAIPGKIIEINGDIAKVDYDGVKKDAKITLFDDLNTGDYVIAKGGFIIQTLKKEEAIKSLELLKKCLKKE